MERRDVLRAFGAATALAFLPAEDAVAAWARVATELAPANGLTDAQLALVASVADTIIPRTGTPGATDVGVPAFVNVVVAENYTESERAEFTAGLAAIGERMSSASSVGAAIETLEAIPDRRIQPARTYWRLKGLIVHGYFTSERVTKDVLHFEVMPGRFDGAEPMPHAITSVASTTGHA